MPLAIACSDKFRGTLTAGEATDRMARGLRRAGFEVRSVPLADGGEGTLETLLASRGGSRRVTRVTGPLGDPVDAEYGVLSDGTAVVEMAQASGLALVTGPRDPLRASTRGTGELIAAARRGGASRIVVAVGGSASTDGGLGAVQALGWSLGGVEVVVACDVTTRFLDAAARFAPQKGASGAQATLLGRRLDLLAQEYRSRTGVDVTALDGAGAAGGLAGGLAAIGARLEAGFDVVAQAVGFEEALEAADLVVTGEGKLDASSFEGKVVGGVLEWAADLGVPNTGVIAGQVTDEGRDELTVVGAVALVVLSERVGHGGEAFARAGELVEAAAYEVGSGAAG